MKRVTFEVAKAIKAAGFPQDSDIYYYDSYGKLNVYESYSTMCLHNGYRAPFYLEVWLWLWREKRKSIDIVFNGYSWESSENCEDCNDPEEAIIAAINAALDYLEKKGGEDDSK